MDRRGEQANGGVPFGRRREHERGRNLKQQDSGPSVIPYLQSMKSEAESLALGDDAALDVVQRQTTMFIRKLFGEEHAYQTELNGIFFPSRFLCGEQEYREDWTLGKHKLNNLVLTMLKEIEVFGDPTEDLKSGAKEAASRVFVSHGHDPEMKQGIVSFVTRVGLEPVVLEDRPNEGRTIIEKLEHYSNVAFAVILFSPDDLAYPKRRSPSEARPRARQNVVLELGYFAAKLGRKNVVLLKKGEGLEIPSVFDGVMHVAYDELGAWRHSLAAELRVSGREIDTSRLFEMDLEDMDIPF
jgi:predicted nucleotide-binding protein